MSNSHVFFFLLNSKGDENDPDQQSDSEEGSTKGEPQVTHLTHRGQREH